MHGFVLRATLAAVVFSLTLGVEAAAPSAAPPGGVYTVTPLVSDVPGAAATVDPHLVNAWGRARSATSPWWVADNGTGKSTLYPVVGTNLGTNPLVVDVAGG